MSLLLSPTALFGDQVEALARAKVLLRRDALLRRDLEEVFEDGNNGLGEKGNDTERFYSILNTVVWVLYLENPLCFLSYLTYRVHLSGSIPP